MSVVKFANNDRSKLCCVSHDGTVSICDVTASPPKVSFILEGHTKAVTGKIKKYVIVIKYKKKCSINWDWEQGRAVASNWRLRRPLL